MEFVSKLAWYVLFNCLQGFSMLWVKELHLNSTQGFPKQIVVKVSKNLDKCLFCFLSTRNSQPHFFYLGASIFLVKMTLHHKTHCSILSICQTLLNIERKTQFHCRECNKIFKVNYSSQPNLYLVQYIFVFLLYAVVLHVYVHDCYLPFQRKDITL